MFIIIALIIPANCKNKIYTVNGSENLNPSIKIKIYIELNKKDQTIAIFYQIFSFIKICQRIDAKIGVPHIHDFDA